MANLSFNTSLTAAARTSSVATSYPAVVSSDNSAEKISGKLSERVTRVPVESLALDAGHSVSVDGDTYSASDGQASSLSDMRDYVREITKEPVLDLDDKNGRVNLDLETGENTSQEVNRSYDQTMGEAQDLTSTQTTGSSSVTSLAGYTSFQVEQMYIHGEISRTEYERSIDLRETTRNIGILSDNSSITQFTSSKSDTLKLERQAEEAGQLWDYQLLA